MLWNRVNTIGYEGCFNVSQVFHVRFVKLRPVFYIQCSFTTDERKLNYRCYNTRTYYIIDYGQLVPYADIKLLEQKLIIFQFESIQKISWSENKWEEAEHTYAITWALYA